jgi:hypothetical protein
MRRLDCSLATATHPILLGSFNVYSRMQACVIGRAGKEHVTRIYAADAAVGRFLTLYHDIAADHHHHN